MKRACVKHSIRHPSCCVFPVSVIIRSAFILKYIKYFLPLHEALVFILEFKSKFNVKLQNELNTIIPNFNDYSPNKLAFFTL